MKTLIPLSTWLLALVLALAVAGSGATAAPAAPPKAAAAAETQILLQAWQVQHVVEAGARKERLQPLMSVRPGDVIEYEARYINSAAHKSQGVQLTLPVPAGGVQYLPQAATATPVHSASLDGVRFEPVPLRRAVRQANGTLAMQEVPPSEYRFLRWNLGDLPAGANRVVRARMHLPQLATTASRT